MVNMKYLNIGSSEVRVEGCINVDIDHKTVKDIDVAGDILALPFKNEIFDGVIAHQIFEHLNKVHHFPAIKECYRVLKMGGKLSVEVPDFPVVLKNYLENHLGMRQFWENCIFGRQLYDGDIHRSGINEQDLTDMLFYNNFGNLKWKTRGDRIVPNLHVIATKLEKINEWSIV